MNESVARDWNTSFLVLATMADKNKRRSVLSIPQGERTIQGI
jgi:hypothetical protein